MVSFLSCLLLGFAVLSFARAADLYLAQGWEQDSDDMDVETMQAIYSSHQNALEEEYFHDHLKELAESQTLLESCLRNNCYYQDWSAPCYTSWLLFISYKVLPMTAKTILETFSFGLRQRVYVRGWEPTREDLVKLSGFSDPIFNAYCIEGTVEREEAIHQMILAWSRCFGQEHMTLAQVTKHLAFWIFSLTFAWPELSRKYSLYDQTPLVPIYYDQVDNTLSIKTFESVFTATKTDLSEKAPEAIAVDGNDDFEDDDETKVKHKVHTNNKKDLKAEYRKLERILRCDPEQNLNGIRKNAYGPLLSMIEKQIKTRLIPLALQKFNNTTVKLYPINKYYKWTVEKLKKFQSLESTETTVPRMWIKNAVSALTGDKNYLEFSNRDNVVCFTYWYASLTVFALGPSNKIAYYVEDDILFV